MTDDEVMWIRTQPSQDGKRYVVTIEASQDRALTLTPANAMLYAGAVIEIAERAEYDAMVAKQLRSLDVEEDHVLHMVSDLRNNRTPVNRRIFGGHLNFDGGVSLFTGEPFLTIFVDGKPAGQLSPLAAKRHALGVIEAVKAAELDEVYYRLLRKNIGLNETVARNVVSDLASLRPDVEEDDPEGS